MSSAQPPPDVTYPPGPYATPPATKKRRWPFAVVCGLVAVMGYGIGTAGDTGPTTAVPAPTKTVTATTTVTAPTEGGGAPTITEAEPEPEPTKAPAAFNPKPKDFTVGIKILRKECFGSAGCNLTYRIVPKYVAKTSIPPDAVLDVTYEVSGAEDPIVGTFTVEDGKAQYNEEESASTTSSAKKLSAKVTEVSVQ